MLAAIALLAGVAYAALVEPNRIVLEQPLISAPRLARAVGQLRIVQLADLHLVADGGLAERVAARVTALRPDLILITGDLLGSGGPEALTRFLARLHPTLGTFAIPGDSDAHLPLPALAQAVRAGAARLLVEEVVLLPLPNGREVALVGSSGFSPLDGLLQSVPPEVPIVLLVPDLGNSLQPREEALHLSVEQRPAEGYLRWRWVEGSKWGEVGAPFRFVGPGPRRLRLQRGQHGILIDELRLEPVGGGEPVVLHHGSVREAHLHGCWEWRAGEWGATHGPVLADWPARDDGDVPLPVSDEERVAWLTFDAPAGVLYRMRARVRCHARGNGSVFAQLDDAVDEGGRPIFRPGVRVPPLGGAGRVDLVLTGGTHGGQVRLPVVSRLLFGVPLPAGGRLLSGLARVRGVPVYVHRGVGTSHLPLRLFAPPEITRFVLR